MEAARSIIMVVTDVSLGEKPKITYTVGEAQRKGDRFL